MDDETAIGLIKDDITNFFWKRLFFWVVRWTIGFGLIGICTHYFENTWWLWIVGGIVATLSLSLFIYIARLGYNKADKITKAMLDSELPTS